MQVFRKNKISPDHIGPISLGFCHRPRFNPMTASDNSAKNNRMTLQDVALLIKDELNGEEVVSWHSKYIWDLGANTGEFSRIAAGLGAFVVSVDSDPSVIEYQYLNNRVGKVSNILPLCIDILNPTPNLGWMNLERESFINRPKPDTILALAIIHHLAIGENIPLSNLAEALSTLTEKLIIEFVPKTDPQVKEMLLFREDIFPSYTQAGFEAAFAKHFSPIFSKRIRATDRWIYVFKKKKAK